MGNAGIPRNGERAGLALRLAPIAFLTAAACGLAWRERGSIEAAHWLPYAAGAALVLAVLLVSGTASRPALPAVAGGGALLALAAWDAVSIAWSPAPRLARDEALLAAFYACVFLVAATAARGDWERVLSTSVVLAGLGTLAIATALALVLSTDPAAFYEDRRLYFPTSYPNAVAALFLVAFWPAAALAAQRTIGAGWRALALGAGVALLGCWLLAQSKGGGLALAASALVVFAVCPWRLRLLVPAAIAGGLAAAGAVLLTKPFRAEAGAPFGAAVADGGAALLALAAAGAVLGLAYAAIDRRVSPGPRVRRASGALVLAALLVAAVAGVAGFAAAVAEPRDYLAERWESFKEYPERETASTHLFTLGSNRYDFWRVALNEFRAHPVAGIGARGFGPTYLEKGQSVETPQHAHSLPMDTLSETGVVGFALLAAGLAFPLALVAARARRSLVASGLLGAGAYFVAHVAVDWVWTVPSVGVSFFLLLGIGASADSGSRPVDGAAGAAAGAGALALAVVAFAPPWLSSRFTERAYADRATSAESLRWARRLDPLATAPYLAEAALADSPGDLEPLRRAVAKEPRRAELRYLLGRAYLAAGRRSEARRELEVARRLYPGGELIEKALREAR